MSRLMPLVVVLLAFWLGRETGAGEEDAGSVGKFDRVVASELLVQGKDSDGTPLTIRIKDGAVSILRGKDQRNPQSRALMNANGAWFHGRYLDAAGKESSATSWLNIGGLVIREGNARAIEMSLDGDGASIDLRDDAGDSRVTLCSADESQSGHKPGIYVEAANRSAGTRLDGTRVKTGKPNPILVRGK